MYPELRRGDVIAGRFEVGGRLGGGSFGDVYRAEQRSTGREVALKILHPAQRGDGETTARFRREARQTCQLSHPNTVTCFDFGEDEQRRLMFIAMEYLPGESLQERLGRSQRLSPKAAVRLIEQVAGSLDEAHGRGLVHRDVKPANIMLVGRGPGALQAKVIDFGIAKIVDQGGEPPLTAANTVLGTPHYMSPEQIRGYDLDGRADVYALGVVAFEVLTGRRPFEGVKNLDVLKGHVFEPIPSVFQAHPGLDVPRGVADAITRALAKDREERWGSAQAFAEALRAGFEGRPIEDARPDTLRHTVMMESPIARAAPLGTPVAALPTPPAEALPRWFWTGLGTTITVVAALVIFLVVV